MPFRLAWKFIRSIPIFFAILISLIASRIQAFLIY
jgi:hypothetical protein